MTDDLAYDLRQKYAEIVGTHLEIISRGRMSRDYPGYFHALEDLFTIIKHKFKKKKKQSDEDGYDPTYVKDGNKEKEKITDLEKFYELRKFAIEKANEYKTVYLGQTEDPKQIEELERSLREMEMFLFYVMDGANMFGRTGYNEGM